MLLARYWSGWGALSEVYTSAGGFTRMRRWTFISAWMGVREGDSLLGRRPLFSLMSCLTIAVNETGVRLSLFPLFRLCHPPLFIPWDHVSIQNQTGFVSDWIEFRFREAPSVVLRINDSVGNAVARYAPTERLLLNERTTTPYCGITDHETDAS